MSSILNHKDFIFNILVDYGGLKPITASQILSQKFAISMYMKAFTHSSFNNIHNYERLETLGDKIYNSYIMKYIFKDKILRKYINVDWTSRIVIYFVQSKFLAKAALKFQFDKYIRIGGAFKTSFLGKNMIENPKFLKILEDVVESFIGCTYLVLSQQRNIFGKYGDEVADAVNRHIVTSIIQSEPFEPTVELFDAVSRLKIVSDKQKWGDIKKILKSKQDPKTQKWTSTLYEPYELNKREHIIAIAEHPVKVESQQMVSKLGLKYFEPLGYKFIPPDPFSSKIKTGIFYKK